MFSAISGENLNGQELRSKEVQMSESCKPGWQDIGLIGALAEELAEAERERQRLLEELQPDEEDENGPGG
jgi:hypothetical protein